MSPPPDRVDQQRLREALAQDAYASDTIRLRSSSLAGATHLVASRQGLYAINESEWILLVHGYFFGVTLRGDEIFAFEGSAPPRREPWIGGRIVRLVRSGDAVVEASVVARGLDNGCHQIDILDGRLHVVDTYRQRVLRFGSDLGGYEVVAPLPLSPDGRWLKHDERYVHVNSILQVGERILLLLHNTSESTGRASEVAVYDTQWREQSRWLLDGRSCHGLAMLEEGRLLTCDSMAGDLIDLNGFRVHVSPHMTRGLAVGEDDIAVGGSPRAEREKRLSSAGTVSFLDRDFRLRSVLDVPGAPTEIRRLDGRDLGLSDFLRTMAWGENVIGPSDIRSGN